MKIHEYNEMMAYLTRPAVNRTGFSQGTKKVAGLTEEYYGKDELKYQEAVKNGFQGTFEEYLQWMRKNAAQGGVIGKGGMFQGEDLGYRTGFKKIYLPNTQRGTEYIDTTVQKAYEKYLKTELAKGDMSETLKFSEWRKKNKLNPNLRIFKNLWAEYKNKLLSDLIDAAEAGEKYVEKQDIMKKVTKISKDATFTASWRTPQNIKKMANIEGYATKVSKVLDNIIKNNDIITTYDIPGFSPSGMEKGKGTGMSNLKGMIMERAGTTDKLKLKEGLNKNKWYRTNKKAFEYLSQAHSTEFVGEKFFDAFEFAKERAGGKTAILGDIKGRFPLPEEYIKAFALRHWEQNNFSGTGKESQITLIDRKTGKPIKWENLPESKDGRKLLDAGNVDFKIKGSNVLWNKANLKKYGPTSNLFTDVYTATQQFNETLYKDVPDPKNPNKTVKFKELLIKAYKEPQPVALGHDDALGGIKKNPFKNLTLMTRDMNTSLFRAYKHIKNKDLRNQIVSKIFGNLKGKKGQEYLDAFIDNNVERATNIIQKKETYGKTAYRKAATEIVGSKDFLKYSPTKQAEAAKLAGAAYRQVNALLQGADKPTIMKIRKALGCETFASGGRVGFLSGGNLLECPMAKFAKDPKGTLNIVGRAVPETRSPILDVLKKAGAPLAKWGGRAFVAAAPAFVMMETMDAAEKFREGEPAGQIAADTVSNLLLPGVGASYELAQKRKMMKDIASPSELAAMEKEDKLRYAKMLQEDPLRETDYGSMIEENISTPAEQLDRFNLEEKTTAAYDYNKEQRKEQRQEVQDQFFKNIREKADDYLGGSYTDTNEISLDDIVKSYYNQGGRVGFAEGPKDPSKRLFIKGLGALAMLPIVGKYFKLAPKAKKVAGVILEKTSGMPDWFQPFVNKVLKEGKDVTDEAATMERQIVKRVDIEDATVDVHYDVATNDVRVEVVGGKTAFDEPLEMQYKAPEVLEESGKKTKAEFSAAESRPRATGPDDIELDSVETDILDDLLSETDYLEGYATGKIRTPLQIKKARERAKLRQDAQRDPYSLLEDIDD